ncbi:hypothetical protein HGRIS_006872 [Hohenbuehelia grisea]|uniref:Uncharacterized protein n=1 Tax=Hohenbuehelia grisea TaxID=104357 RepID=A0ABR3JAV8_9AGAR
MLQAWLEVSYLSVILSIALSLVFLSFVTASPRPQLVDLERRTYPEFPEEPPSCPICQRDYPSISSCAEASPVLQNFSMIIFNPGAFIDVIKCACTDTFQSVFPQCVDCFVRTNQTDVLETPDLPAVVEGMRKVCGVASSILGNVSASNGEVTPAPEPSPTPAPASNFGLNTMELGALQSTMCVLSILLGMLVVW